MTDFPESTYVNNASSPQNTWERVQAVVRTDSPGYVAPHHVDGIEIHIHLGAEVNIRWREDGPYHRTATPPGRTAILRDRPYSERFWEEPGQYLRITIPRDAVEADDALAGAVPPGHWIVPGDPFHGFGMLLFNEMRAPAFHGNLVVETIIGSILANSGVPGTDSHVLSARRLGAVIEYLLEAGDDTVRVEDLASQANMSVYAFSRAFKNSTGYSPYQFSLRLKIEHSKVLLGERRHIGAAIAATMGFHDEAHFSRTFKRLTGVTPAEWQRRVPR